MAAKRADCVLVVDQNEHLAGIFTAKDLAYRVVSEALDAHTTYVSQIMTPNPMCVTLDASATDALNTMVQRGFRHLPVCNEEGDVVGLLDITKCLYDSLEKMERAYGSSRKLYDALETIEKEWSSQANQILQLMGNLKDNMSCPDLSTILDDSHAAQVSTRTSVRDAARMMKQHHTTSVVVMDNGVISGIFTSKDVVLRVVAASLDPANCSVIRVMTPHPDTCPPETTILEALKRMHTGHYLNLPVVDADKQVLGVVDVLKLTYATLELMSSIDGASDNDSNAGPVWNKFWTSSFSQDDISESVVSDSMSRTYESKSVQDVYPNDSISVVDEENQSTQLDIATGSFVFKFKSPKGKVYRFSAATDHFEQLRAMIEDKLVEEDPSTDIVSIPPLCYVDDEGDHVLLSSDEDLLDAVDMARKNNWQRLILFLSHSDEEPQDESVSSFVREQAPPAPLPQVEEPVVKQRSDTPVRRHVSDSKEQLIPDHLIIPASIGAGFLAATIVGLIIWKATARSN
jgi:CBS domain-containing protein